MYFTPGLGDGSIVWVPLTLEPGQVVVRFSGPMMQDDRSRDVSLGMRGTAGRISQVVLETVEQLRPLRGRYRVETLNAFFLGEMSLFLRRRTVVARIESLRPVSRVFSSTHPVSVVRESPFVTNLVLDVAGHQTAGRFRFFYSLGDDGGPETHETAVAADVPGSGAPLPGGSNDFLEPRWSRLRRSRSLRRLP